MSNYLQASDVIKPEFLKRLRSQGLEVMDPNRIRGHIFKLDKEGRPTAMLVRALTANAYKAFSGGAPLLLGGDGSGAELWLPLPKIGDEDPAGMRQFMTPKYSGNNPKESGQEGRVDPALNQPNYGSGWDPDESSVPGMGSTGNRGPQSGGGAQVTPAMPEDIETQEDEALDDNIKNKTNWPGHFDVTIESRLKLDRLYNWLIKNSHEREAEYLNKKIR
jgi:hypothetical protein